MTLKYITIYICTKDTHTYTIIQILQYSLSGMSNWRPTGVTCVTRYEGWIQATVNQNYFQFRPGNQTYLLTAV